MKISSRLVVDLLSHWARSKDFFSRPLECFRKVRGSDHGAEALESKSRARPLDIEVAKSKRVALGGSGIFE
jgi:hypothetical protein